MWRNEARWQSLKSEFRQSTAGRGTPPRDPTCALAKRQSQALLASRELPPAAPASLPAGRVYGCCGAVTICSVGPTSTNSPRCITAGVWPRRAACRDGSKCACAKIAKRKTPRQMRFVTGFSQSRHATSPDAAPAPPHADRENRWKYYIPQCGTSRECTIFRHRPVDELHSSENTEVAGAIILLTLPAGGVKPQSFSDDFWFFNAGCKLSPERKRWSNRPNRDLERKRLPRAHGAKQDATRDVAGSRRRAESAEARRNPESSRVDPACCESGNPLSKRDDTRVFGWRA